MRVDENEFFRQATLRICSSLDIQKALFNCLQYIQAVVPASEMNLGLFEPSIGSLRILASVDLAGSKKSFPPIPASREMAEVFESNERTWEQVRIVDRVELDSLGKILRPYIDFSGRSVLVMNLAVEGQRLGTLAILAEGKGRFTAAHVRLISLLREPFSIAMSNALRFEEMVKLKDMLDAENRELNRELKLYPLPSVSPEGMERLRGYRWPGNVMRPCPGTSGRRSGLPGARFTAKTEPPDCWTSIRAH